MEKLNIDEFIRKVSFLSCHKFKSDIPKNENESDLVHINDLMALSDDEFIESVYRKILRRAADAEGKLGKVQDLADNSRTRLDILNELKSSDEAQNYKEVIILGLGGSESQVTSYEIDFDDFIVKKEFSEFEFSLLLDYLNEKHAKYSQWLNENEGLVFDLLEYDSIDFIFLTYKILLQRDPDFVGFTDYIANLDNSYVSKIEIIYEFSQSDEYQYASITIKDISLKEISKLDSPEQISFDLGSEFASLHHFLHLRNKDFQLAEMSVSRLADQNTLCFMYLLMEKIHIPFSERLKYFNRYIPKIMRKEITKIDVIYQLLHELELVSVNLGASFLENATPLLSSFYGEDTPAISRMMDMLGKNIFSNATDQDVQANNIYYRLNQESLQQNIYQRCKDQLLAGPNASNKPSSLTEELYLLTKCIGDSATKDDIAGLNSFLENFIDHVDLMAEVLVDHENKMNDWEGNS